MKLRNLNTSAELKTRKLEAESGSWVEPAEWEEPRRWMEPARLWMASLFGTQELGGWTEPAKMKEPRGWAELAEEGGPGNYS